MQQSLYKREATPQEIEALRLSEKVLKYSDTQIVEGRLYYFSKDGIRFDITPYDGIIPIEFFKG
jgi:hypothetical protein